MSLISEVYSKGIRYEGRVLGLNSYPPPVAFDAFLRAAMVNGSTVAKEAKSKLKYLFRPSAEDFSSLLKTIEVPAGLREIKFGTVAGTSIFTYSAADGVQTVLTVSEGFAELSVIGPDDYKVRLRLKAALKSCPRDGDPVIAYHCPEQDFKSCAASFLEAIQLSRPAILVKIRVLLKTQPATSSAVFRSVIELVAARNPELKNNFSFDYSGARLAEPQRITWQCDEPHKTLDAEACCVQTTIHLVRENNQWYVKIEGRNEQTVEPRYRAAQGLPAATVRRRILRASARLNSKP